MRVDWIRVVAVAVALAIAACGGRPVQDGASAGAAFGALTGPTAFTEGSAVCPPPPEPSPEGCTPPTGEPPPGAPAPAPSAYIWLAEGPRLTNASAGFTGVLADTSTIQLTDGRWRMFLFAGDQYRSASSTDGLSFTMDPGTRLPVGLGHIRVIRLPDRRIRAFSIVHDGIVSSVSSDEGLTFTREPGHSVRADAIGFTPSGASLARMQNGTWRMYFSSLPRPGEGPQAHRIRSASSIDLLTWTLDQGVRIGPGSALEGGEHPAAIGNPDGSVSLVYFRATTFRMMMATSRDGLTFTSEFDTGISQANDPDLVMLPDGSVRMYYNWGDNASGVIYSALYSGAPFSATAPLAAPKPSGEGGVRFR